MSEGVAGLPKNINESLLYLNRACEGKNSIACVKLFNLYMRDKNSDSNWKKDPTKAFYYTKKACEYNDLFGCMNAARMCYIGY